MGRLLAPDWNHVVHAASEGDKFNADSSLVVVDCAVCGITYAIPESLRRSALKYHGDRPNGWKLCCPLGHEWWYVGKTEKEQLQEKIDWQRSRAGRLASQLDQTEASRRAQKAATTRARRQRDHDRTRVQAGVCPCCNRSFKNLARHMAGQHPEYGPVGDDE
jgi:hypothetical protein